MAVNPWAWQEGRNPYRSTPFQVLALDVNMRGRAAFLACVTKRRQRIKSAPERFPLFGRVLSEAEVNRAEELLRDPRTRLLAELCTHRPRLASVQASDLDERLAGIAVPDDAAPVRIALRALRRLLPAPQDRSFPSLWTGHDA